MSAVFIKSVSKGDQSKVSKETLKKIKYGKLQLTLIKLIKSAVYVASP